MKLRNLFKIPKRLNESWKDEIWAMILLILCILILIFCVRAEYCHGQGLTASWYSVKSCLREGTSGIMANGRRLRDEEKTCASWDYPFGTRLRITNTDNGRSTITEVTDRGPARSLYREGRVIDLSVAAMRELNGIRRGVIPITVEVVK